jgi:tRNA 5-methylaminomethyl-2-thiouridine biosynthesis bifunctional protein
MFDTRDKGAPRSKEFDDVYFSAKDGLAETRYVFLKSNFLPAAWLGKDHFVIGETGFGTGLNFLAAWALFKETTNGTQKLHFISFEKFPLSALQIEEYLEPWKEEFPDLLRELISKYPIVVPGAHRMEFDDGTTLTLFFEDVNEALPRLSGYVDCWFLDGFRPASNPDMWTDTVFQNMARLSREETSFATFTAAGFVKRGLKNAGFEVHKVDGFGTKRDMLVGKYTKNISESSAQ